MSLARNTFRAREPFAINIHPDVGYNEKLAILRLSAKVPYFTSFRCALQMRPLAERLS